MARMTRRGFLGALAAAAATVAGAPAFAAVEKIDRRFCLIGKRIVLDKPLVLSGLDSFEIRDCIISASENFVGDKLLVVKNCERAVIVGCCFETGNVGWSSDAGFFWRQEINVGTA